MDKKLWSIEEVAAKVDNEGLGYAVQYYMSGDSIEDPELAALWDKARAIMDEIDEILGPYYE